MKYENDLWRRYKKTQDPGLKEELIMMYAPLVKYIAGKIFAGNIPGVEYDDLVSYGIIGLLDAIGRYNPELGYKFKSYAVKRIKGAIIDELRNIDCLPRSIRQKLKSLEEAYIKLEKGNEFPSDEEVAKELGITLEELQKLFNWVSFSTTISIEELKQEYEGGKSISFELVQEEKATTSPEVFAEKEELKENITEAIKKLSKKERDVIILYYYEDLTQKEIGEVLGLSEGRVSQLHGRAIAKLKSYLKKVVYHV